MNSSDQPPKLPLWIFIATDLALIAAAAFIATRSAHPLSMKTTLAIVGCAMLGAIVGLVPIIARFERLKNETLDDRQRALEALARTVSASAEQISIAAGGLHEITELAQKNLRHAEQLPHKLQEKIAEFQAQLATATDADKEELERELLALRTTESERLETVSQRIAKSAAEWTKLETATSQQLAAANDAVAKLSFGTASAIGKAQAAAEQALAQARTEAARTLGDASGQATRAIDTAKNAALAEFDAKLAALARALDERLARLETSPLPATPPAAAASAPVVFPAAEETAPAPESVPPIPLNAPLASPPKRARRPRRDETSSTDPFQPAASAAPTGEPEAPAVDVAPPAPVAEEPAPVPLTKIAEVAPVAPVTADPFSDHLASVPHGSAEPDAAPPRAARKPVVDDEPALGLELDEGGLGSSASMAERVLSSDGATRLLVTAYIGIGNRLFIRGAGPGLSWEKGVPLHFISIGKWRWETAEATGPVQFKLYKNDTQECAALGTQALDPGHQQEVTAAF